MSDRKLAFVVDAKISQLGIPVASAQITGLDNTRRGPQDSENTEDTDNTDNTDKARNPPWSGLSLASSDDHPILRGYRDLHTAVGRSNKRFVSSPEALIRCYLRNGSLPQVNPVVDLYNRLSLETLLSIGAHDAAKVSGDVFFRVTDGTEHFVALRSDPGKAATFVPIPPGEYGYVDSANDLLCRMECRQADKSKLDARTTDCVFIVQGNRNTPEADVQRTLDTLVERVLARCGGRAWHLHRADG